MMSHAIEMKCPYHHEIMGGPYESASCGLDSDMAFMKSCSMRTLAHECLVVPVGMTII
jgi:hypothetical protein